MKTLYIDAGMGAAGDMLTAALLELTDNPEETLKELNALGIPDIRFEAETTAKCGITGTHMHVFVGNEEEGEHEHHHHHHHDHEHSHDHDHEHCHCHEHSDEHDHEHCHDHDHEHEHCDDHEHDHEHCHKHDHEHSHDEGHGHHHHHGHGHHHHSSMHDIGHIVNDHLNIDPEIKKDIMDVYQMIAEAESQVHNTPVTEIHFHEVGTMDAIADITAVCYLMKKLAVEQVIVSPVHVGSGTVRCAHGILPVPAPATANILKGIPIYSGKIRGELCTPTGAALLKHFADRFGNMPVMTVEKIGYGMGKKDFEQANCVRVFLAESN